jgi:hypothetical protein
MKVVILSALLTGRIYLPSNPTLPQEIFLVLISLEVESIPGQYCGLQNYVDEKFE